MIALILKVVGWWFLFSVVAAGFWAWANYCPALGRRVSEGEVAAFAKDMRGWRARRSRTAARKNEAAHFNVEA